MVSPVEKVTRKSRSTVPGLNQRTPPSVSAGEGSQPGRRKPRGARALPASAACPAVPPVITTVLAVFSAGALVSVGISVTTEVSSVTSQPVSSSSGAPATTV